MNFGLAFLLFDAIILLVVWMWRNRQTRMVEGHVGNRAGSSPVIHTIFLSEKWCTDNKPVWRNWQTRRIQNPVMETSCGFEPHHRYQQYDQ